MQQNEPCLHGHLMCSTVFGGPCADEEYQNEVARKERVDEILDLLFSSDRAHYRKTGEE